MTNAATSVALKSSASKRFVKPEELSEPEGREAAGIRWCCIQSAAWTPKESLGFTQHVTQGGFKVG